MIATLKGKIEVISSGYIILEVAGVGYKIFVNSKTLIKVAKGEIKKFFAHQYIRENQLDLYGFLNFEELEVFELLILVSGIGPKAALMILTRAEPSQIKSAIINGDLDLFTAVSGVGRKTATRIILDLKGKISSDDLSILNLEDSSEIIDALKNLGYKAGEATKVIAKIPKNLKSDDEKIRWALQQLLK